MDQGGDQTQKLVPEQAHSPPSHSTKKTVAGQTGFCTTPCNVGEGYCFDNAFGAATQTEVLQEHHAVCKSGYCKLNACPWRKEDGTKSCCAPNPVDPVATFKENPNTWIGYESCCPDPACCDDARFDTDTRNSHRRADGGGARHKREQAGGYYDWRVRSRPRPGRGEAADQEMGQPLHRARARASTATPPSKIWK